MNFSMNFWTSYFELFEMKSMPYDKRYFSMLNFNMVNFITIFFCLTVMMTLRLYEFLKHIFTMTKMLYCC